MELQCDLDYADVVQLAEAAVSKTACCGFESHHPHHFKKLMQLSEIFNPSLDLLKKLRPTLAKVAQEEYDSWNEENIDEYGGGGGICHLIADGIVDELASNGIEATTVSSNLGEVHVYVVAKLPHGVFNIDINPFTYETGGGYQWKKIQNVEFTKEDVEITLLDSDPDNFEQYIDEY